MVALGQPPRRRQASRRATIDVDKRPNQIKLWRHKGTNQQQSVSTRDAVSGACARLDKKKHEEKSSDQNGKAELCRVSLPAAGKAGGSTHLSLARVSNGKRMCEDDIVPATATQKRTRFFAFTRGKLLLLFVASVNRTLSATREPPRPRRPESSRPHRPQTSC